VVDDGGNLEACKRVLSKYPTYGLIAKPRTIFEGKPINGMPMAVNIGVGHVTGDIVLVIQRDHVLAADYIARLAAYYEVGSVFFGLTQRIPWVPSHRWIDQQKQLLYVPDVEERFRLLAGSNRFNAEFTRWSIVDGMDFAVEREKWLPFDENPVLLYHCQPDWALRMQLTGMRLLVNPLLRLWHTGIDPTPTAEINAAVARGTVAMGDKWQDQAIWHTFPLRFVDIGHLAQTATSMERVVEGVVL